MKTIGSLYTVANGTSKAIESVPDEVFSTKILGEGIAVQPIDGYIYAPCDGRITMIMKYSLYALGMVNQEGMEILIHIGIDSVELMGEGFQLYVKKDDYVHMGDLIMKYDPMLFKQRGINDVIMMVIVESNKHEPIIFHINEKVEVTKSKLIEYQ